MDNGLILFQLSETNTSASFSNVECSLAKESIVNAGLS
jgi:hypothetical protein